MSVEFHPLTVIDISPETDDAVSVTVAIPPELRERFRHRPGQHVVIRAELDGVDVRRSYSICDPPGGDTLRVGIKRIPGGVFSTYATTGLAAGDVLQVMAPIGDFVTEPGSGTPRTLVMIAAGSGITPVLAMVAAALRDEPSTSVIVVYGNRTTRSIMFHEDLEALKNRYPTRLQVLHVLSREPNRVPLFEGRIDGERLELLCRTLIDPGTVDGWFLCGPLDMVETLTATLERIGVPGGRVHSELFFDQRIETVPAASGDDAAAASDGGHRVEVTFTLDGRTSTVAVDPGGPPLLDHARTVRTEVPFACKGGMCATCRAVLSEGTVVMAKNYALTAEEIAAGHILTCQAHPTGDGPVTFSYDIHATVQR
ncbi:MAG: 2Fe-2S iron-sulfur cluster-binding protein [Acidimicrobiales bacterium]